MGLCRNLFSSAALAAGLVCGTGSAYAQGSWLDAVGGYAPADEVQSSWTAAVDFASPLDDFDANTKMWYSLNQLGSAGLASFDPDHPMGRLGVALLDAWWLWSTSYISHEIAHEYAARRNGTHDPFNLDFTDWTYLFPRFIA